MQRLRELLSINEQSLAQQLVILVGYAFGAVLRGAAACLSRGLAGVAVVALIRASRIASPPTQLTLLIVLCVLLVILVQLIAFWLLG
jgi:hypothetical protein